MTVVVTSTDVQKAATVTSTSTAYESAASLKARQTAVPLPLYASVACADWDQYVKACKCAGFEATTVTAPVAVETVTVTADNAVTTTVATISATETNAVSVTATVSVTEINTVLVTETATSTAVITVSATTTISATSTPTSVVPLACRLTGVSFRVSDPFPDGTTRWMNVVNSAAIAWQTFSTNPTAASLATSTWVLDSNGYLELASAVGTTIYAAYISTTATGASVSVGVKAKADVEAAVAAGTALRIKGCVNAATSALTLTGTQRYNMLSCGNGLYFSTGTGTDIRSDCVKLVPTVA